MRRHGLRGLLFTLLFGVALVVIPQRSFVEAQSVPHLDGQISDGAGVVGDGRAALEKALADLLEQRNVQLYAVFVTTTDGQDAAEYARATFEQNGLGGNDLLLLVAVQDRRFAWWDVSAVASLSSTEIDQLLASNAEPRFRAADYAGGVAAFAIGLADALAPGPLPTAPPGGDGEPSPVPQPTGLPSTLVAVVIGLALLTIGVAILWSWWQRRRAGRLTAEERDRRTGQLARDANALLIRADDAVRESDQELAFAEAQFDEPDVAPFRAAIERSRADLKAAFEVRQRLDDGDPEEPDEKEKMLAEIVERGGRIVAALDQERRRMQGLRDEERDAPRTLAALPARIATIEARIAGAEETLEGLRAYAEPTWKPIDGNVAEAKKRVDAAMDEVRHGTEALAAPSPDGVPAAAARRAVRAATEATALLDAVDHLEALIDDARGRLAVEIPAADADLTSARDAAARAPASAALAKRVTDAGILLAQARSASTGPRPDPLGALRDAQAAHAAADEILSGIRDAESKRARELAVLESTIRSAEATVARASDFVTTRRPGVGREARTRLAEAQRHLDAARALRASDPSKATQEAQLSERLAGDAYRYAESDFDDWDRRGRRHDDLGGAILGGLILGNILSGIGRQGGGGWGGTPWGMPGGGHGGGGSWGGLGNIGGGGRGGSGSW